MNDALKIAFTGGSVMGMTVVGVGLLGVVVMYFIFNDANIVTAFGFGASSIALFARVGGGIYTKAADVGADLVGKVEAGIPEDDPRNPAVIADNVGDNVGDIAGMGADLFESYVNSIIAAMAIGALVMDQGGVIYPLLLSAIGIIASILGTFFVRVKEGGDPAKALRIGLGSTGLFMIIGAYFLTNWMFGDLTLFFAVISGVICGLLIGAATEYYTSGDYGSVKEIAAASETGAATNILAGPRRRNEVHRYPGNPRLHCDAGRLPVRRPLRHRLLRGWNARHHRYGPFGRRLRTDRRQRGRYRRNG